MMNEEGKPLYEFEDNIVSFFEATSRALLGVPVVDKDYKREEGCQFMFTMKQNEYFVFPKYDENGKTMFNPMNYDEAWYKKSENYSMISQNLFRVQKFSKVKAGNSYVRDYTFRHHLETTITNNTPEMRGITWQRIQSCDKLENIVKVRVNHIGKIVSIGEY